MTAEEQHYKNRIKELTLFDDAYPERLRYIPDAPKTLYVLGEIPDDTVPTVGIIGARGATEYGLRLARQFAAVLASRGIGIISGMAYGVDSEGHKGAIDAGGRTWAVLGNGLNICYPPSNFALSEKIVQSGGLISEYPLDTPPLPRHFALRNRIIAGLSDVILVMEARERSGTAITVGHALDQGKQVFALPGKITDPLSAGCNQMIAQGAQILTSVDDVLTYFSLKPTTKTRMPDKNVRLSQNEKKVLEVLQTESVHLQQIFEKTQLPLQQLTEILLKLEIEGLAESPVSSYYRRK